MKYLKYQFFLQQKRGFTLMEMLVVVLIIGILGAIALPQYQRAVLKSRFAALMPIAKSMADSNEVYYLDNGEYADNAQDLLIQGQRNYPDGTTLEFGTTTSHAYVLATRGDDFPNHYIVYQKHSVNYPGEIHCEADVNNTQAQEVCKSFGATEDIGETLTSGYLTYVLFGTGHGEPPTGDDGGNDDTGNNTEPEPEPEEPRPTVKKVECGSYQCSYYYNEVSGYVTELISYISTLSCDTENGGCTGINESYNGGGGTVLDQTTGNNHALFFNADGSMNYMRIGGSTDNGGYASYFDASGNYMGGSVNRITNAGGIPDAQLVYYDTLGNVRRIQFHDGTVYAYGADGKALSEDAPVQNVSSYNFLNTQDYMAQQAKANKIKTKTKCQLYPELQECAANTSN